MPSTTTKKKAAAEPSPTMSKAEVCAYVGKSTRTIDSYIASGRLRIAYFNGPNGKTGIFQRTDVEALKVELETPTYRAVHPGERERSRDGYQSLQLVAPSAAGTAMAQIAQQQQQTGGVLALLTEHLAKLAAPHREELGLRMPGPFVTLAEAAKISGMPATWLLAQAKAGVPWAVNIGTGKKAFWRFSIAK